ncbi:MAG TPA: hypothetical protein VFL80_09950 [Thermoanaerobaculia bacterium]|nr:hypothetical protein [Thermoanaerobaculia bacterium]
MPQDVPDLRSEDRYIIDVPIKGSFGAASVAVLNIGSHGVFIEHAQPLRIRTTARLWFKCEDVTVSAHGTVVWSHLSKVANEKGKLLYNSGIRIDDPTEFATSIQALLDRGTIRRDTESLDRKRQRLALKKPPRTKVESTG